MWEWVRQNLNDIGVVFTVFAFALSIGALAFSAFRYVSLRRDELRTNAMSGITRYFAISVEALMRMAY